MSFEFSLFWGSYRLAFEVLHSSQANQRSFPNKNSPIWRNSQLECLFWWSRSTLAPPWANFPLHIKNWIGFVWYPIVKQMSPWCSFCLAVFSRWTFCKSLSHRCKRRVAVLCFSVRLCLENQQVSVYRPHWRSPSHGLTINGPKGRH